MAKLFIFVSRRGGARRVDLADRISGRDFEGPSYAATGFFFLFFIILIHASLRYDYALVLFTAISFIAMLFLFDAGTRYHPS